MNTEDSGRGAFTARAAHVTDVDALYSLFVEVDPVMMHSSGVTAASGMLSVLTCTHTHTHTH